MSLAVMLTDLFNDDENDGDGSKTSSSTKASAKDTAPRFDNDDQTHPRLIGIANQGATCYLNSLVQTLFLTPELRGE